MPTSSGRRGRSRASRRWTRPAIRATRRTPTASRCSGRSTGWPVVRRAIRRARSTTVTACGPRKPWATRSSASSTASRTTRSATPAQSWRRIDDEWLGGVGRLALQLDRGVNNTSLALAFELPGGRTLIFPGDAQIGNWLSWDEVTFEDEAGSKLPTTAKQLLNRAVFYKVGHHGSHNATRKAGGLEEMTGGDLVAMIPTDEKFALTQSPPHGWKMPFSDLYDALKKFTHHRVLRADRGEDELSTEAEETDATATAWAAFAGRVTFAKKLLERDAEAEKKAPDQPLYVEYKIPE